jgi:hypothetical protein
MIYLTSHLHSISVAINPKLVTYVSEAKTGCVVHFTSDSSIHVSNNYLEVIGLLNANM